VSASKFDDSLPILTPRPADPSSLSVCAMGDVAEGDEIIAMRVWIWQEADGQVAASAGKGGDHLGGHDAVPEETPPFRDRWMIQTQLEEGSPQFAPGKPALATAMALLRHGKDGPLDVEHWSTAVMIGEHEHHHG
jgi:hypothetical protein